MALLGHVDEAGFEAEREVLLEPDAQVGRALRLAEMAVGADLGAVGGPFGYLGCAVERQLAVLGPAIAQPPEARPHTALLGVRVAVARGLAHEVGLAAVAPRRGRPGGLQPAVAQAALLTPLRL